MKMRAKNVQCPGWVPGRGRPMLGPAIAADKLRRCLALAAAAAMISALCLGTSDPANASSRATASADALDTSGASVPIGIPVVGGLQAVSNALGSDGVRNRRVSKRRHTSRRLSTTPTLMGAFWVTRLRRSTTPSVLRGQRLRPRSIKVRALLGLKIIRYLPPWQKH